LSLENMNPQLKQLKVPLQKWSQPKNQKPSPQVRKAALPIVRYKPSCQWEQLASSGEAGMGENPTL
jgi:hypothetical protein